MLKGFLRPYYSADTGTQGTGTSASTDNAAGQDKPLDKQPIPQNSGTDDKRFTQAELDAIVRDRLDRAQRKAAEQAEQAKRDAEQKALAEQGEWQKLAEQRQGKIAELEQLPPQLETIKEEVKRYKSALEKHLEATKKDLPKHMQDLLGKLDPVDQLEWIAVNRDAIAAPVAQGSARGGTPTRGLPRQTAVTTDQPERGKRIVRF